MTTDNGVPEVDFDDLESKADMQASDAYLARLLTMTEREALGSVSDLLMALARGRADQAATKRAAKKARQGSP